MWRWARGKILVRILSNYVILRIWRRCIFMIKKIEKIWSIVGIKNIDSVVGIEKIG